MEKLLIEGGHPLRGNVKISGAKNAVLPVIAATLLGQDRASLLEEVPHLEDVATISEIIRSIGAKTEYNVEKETLTVDATNLTSTEAPSELVRKMRASFLIMGPLLSRYGHAKISLPGGCAIGTRPIDLHLKGFEALGAKIEIGHGFIKVEAPNGLEGNRIYLDFPSVGATENILMAASTAKGQTILENPAEEPEIVDLANFLNVMGANIRGAGTNLIKINGVEKLRGQEYAIIPDRIEAGTYMLAAAMTKGDVFIENAISEHLKPVIAKLKEAGATLYEDVNGIRVTCDKPLKSVDIKTLPYPGFPTDMQAQFMAMLSVSEGKGTVIETVFENRFMHVEELRRMGANITVDDMRAEVVGIPELKAARVKATDLRAGAAMVLAGLVAKGETTVTALHHIDRGYDRLVEKLIGLGAQIKRIEE